MMKLTHKTVARMAGYYTYECGPGKVAWRNYHGWIAEVAMWPFDTEEAAYKDCCEACGLVSACGSPADAVVGEGYERT